MKLPQNVQTAIKLLENAGFEVYVVGGAVRDYLLGLVPNDYDLSTNATPEEAKEVFKNYFIVEIGIKHGTISVMIDHKFLEITTYRYEEEYLDSRRPNKVHFIINIEEDLARRDFSINAICYNKVFLDLFGGKGDLDAKIIRCIGEPLKRFSEDPLRILRALRFAAVLDFQIEANTKTAIIENFAMLEAISKERINLELSKLMLGINFQKVMLEYLTLLENYVFKFELKSQAIKAANILDKDLILRLACLCIDLDINEANKRLIELKYSKKQVKTVLTIIYNFSINLDIDELGLLNILKDLDYDILGKIIKIKKAYLIVNNKDTLEIDRVESLYNNLESKVLRIADLKINGNDLIKIGCKEGIKIKEVLEKLLDDCLKGLENDYQVLINKAKEYLKI